jgi:hypothetical protein
MADLHASKTVDSNCVSSHVDVASRMLSGITSPDITNAKRDVVCSTTMDGKVVALNEFFGFPPTKVMSIEDIMSMNDKLFGKKACIIDFVDSKLKETWRVSNLFDKWLADHGLSQLIENADLVSSLAADVGSPNVGTKSYSVSMISALFDSNDGKKLTDQGLIDSDLISLNLLSASGHFGSVKGPEFTRYVKDGLCHTEANRLIRKYDTSVIDKDIIEEHWPRVTKRRSLEIAVFISQYFGRAERVMVEKNVKVLWDSLELMNDLINVIEAECKRLCPTNLRSDDRAGLSSESDTESKTDPLRMPPRQI